MVLASIFFVDFNYKFFKFLIDFVNLLTKKLDIIKKHCNESSNFFLKTIFKDF